MKISDIANNRTFRVQLIKDAFLLRRIRYYFILFRYAKYSYEAVLDDVEYEFKASHFHYVIYRLTNSYSCVVGSISNVRSPHKISYA